MRSTGQPASGLEFCELPVHGLQIEMRGVKAAAAPGQEVLMRLVLLDTQAGNSQFFRKPVP
jgi:hypothetical protein